jgi:ribose transport system substrate-binding protein
VALAALAAAALASASPSSSVRRDALGALQAKLDRYSGVPQFRAPGPAFDARAAAKGKSMFVIPATSNVPFVTTILKGMVKVARSVGGLKITPWPNQGQPTQWVDGLNSAVTQHANLIDLEAGINPALVGPQIARARKAGIAVTVTHFYGLGQKRAPNLSATMDIPYELGGELMADKVILDTNGKANALVLTVNQVLATVPLVSGIRKEFARYCKGCKLTFIDRTIPDLAKYTSDVSTALVKDPKVNYVIAIYDSAQAPQALAGIRVAGRIGKVHLVCFNGTPSFLPSVKNDPTVTLDVGENLDWIAYGAIDQDMRVLAGLKPVANEFIPLRVWTKANIAEAGPGYAGGFGTSYITGYRKLWGLK